MDFETQFHIFLDSVKNKDFETFKSFLDKNLELRVMLPGREPIYSYDEFIESQKSYFESESARFAFQIVKAEESGDSGIGACEAEVVLDDGQVLELQINFLFKKIGDDWKMVFDQNTVL